jgi:hypothetical protein
MHPGFACNVTIVRCAHTLLVVTSFSPELEHVRIYLLADFHHPTQTRYANLGMNFGAECHRDQAIEERKLITMKIYCNFACKFSLRIHISDAVLYLHGIG